MKVKEDRLTPELVAGLKELAGKFGLKIGELFDIEQVLHVQPKLTADRVLKTDVHALFKQAQEAGFVKPYSPALKE